jgi:hypothetical protein
VRKLRGNWYTRSPSLPTSKSPSTSAASRTSPFCAVARSTPARAATSCTVTRPPAFSTAASTFSGGGTMSASGGTGESRRGATSTPGRPLLLVAGGCDCGRRRGEEAGPWRRAARGRLGSRKAWVASGSTRTRSSKKSGLAAAAAPSPPPRLRRLGVAGVRIVGACLSWPCLGPGVAVVVKRKGGGMSDLALHYIRMCASNLNAHNSASRPESKRASTHRTTAAARHLREGPTGAE